jgi:hypothetical protein
MVVRRSALCAAALALSALVVAGQLPQAAVARERAKPVALVSYYDSYRFPSVLRALNRTGLARRGRVFFGNYWGSPRGSKGPPPGKLPSPTKQAGGKYEYAPILALRPGIFWERRRVTRKEGGTLRNQADRSMNGRMPSMGSLVHGGVSRRVRWGRELGRRFRDRVRANRRAGKRVASWQFDEILGAGTPQGGAKRDISRGILDGLLHGRQGLGDGDMRGFVWAAGSGVPLGRLSNGGKAFWRTVNEAAFRLVAEEYVRFEGSPGAAAARSAARRRRFGSRGGVRAELARRYMVGLTPGFGASRSLGGNVGRLSPGRVNGWRRAYVMARGRDFVAGFAVYNLMGPNARPSVIGAVVRAVALGVRMRR